MSSIPLRSIGYSPSIPNTLRSSVYNNDSDLGLRLAYADDVHTPDFAHAVRVGSVRAVIVLRSDDVVTASADIFFTQPYSVAAAALVVLIIAVMAAVAVTTERWPKCMADVPLMFAAVIGQQTLDNEVEAGDKSSMKLFCFLAAFAGYICIGIYTADMASMIASTVTSVGSLEDLDHEGFGLVMSQVQAESFKESSANFPVDALQRNYPLFTEMATEAITTGEIEKGYSNSVKALLSGDDKKLFMVAKENALWRIVPLHHLGRLTMIPIDKGNENLTREVRSCTTFYAY